MEVLGVASGIAGLISLADVLAFKISKYYTLVKSSQSEIRALLIEVQSLYGVLNSLKLLATCLEHGQQPLGPANMPQLDHFQTCRQNLDYLKKSLSKLDLDSATKLTAFKIKLLWPFKATETKELVERIARNKRDLADALTADGLTALVNALSTQTDLTEAVEDVQMRLQKMAEEKGENEQDERKKAVFGWCSTVTPYEKHRNAKSLRHPNTVLWFFESPEFKKWISEPNSGIWLYGIPGAGKTILTSAVIEEAKMLAATKPDHAIAYFYVEYRLPETQLLSNILGSLIRQLCASSEDAFEELESFYRECNEKSKHPVLPTCEQLGELLSRISKCFECVMVVIDGLDESSDPQERSSTMHLLSTLNAPENGTIKIVYTSRDEIDIRRNFESFEGMSIAARSNDLELYVAAVIELRMKNKSLRMRDPALKEVIINGIISKANGMFQWAKCQLDYLCTLSTDKERRRALETLPADLFETYTRILNRVAKSTAGNRRLVERTLRWIHLAQFPLHVDTIATAVAVEIGSRSIDEDDISDQDSILKWCSSLVTKNEQTGILSFSHFTVEEFLTDEKLLAIPELRDFYLNEPESQGIIAKVCLTYLQFPEFWHWDLRDSKSIIDKADELPFLKYCCQEWLSHANYGEIEDDEHYHDLTQRLFNPEKSSNFVLWLHIWWAEHGPYNVEAPTAPTLNVAAALQLVHICSWLLDTHGCDLNFNDATLGTPLIGAIRGIGYMTAFTAKNKLVRLLLSHGAIGDVNFSGHDSLVGRDDNSLPRKVIRTPMSLALDIASRDVECCCAVFRQLLEANCISSCAESSVWSTFIVQRESGRPIRKALPLPPLPPRPDYGEGRSAIIRRSSNASSHLTGSDSAESPERMLVALFRDALNHPESKLLDLESRSKMIAYITTHGNETSDQELISTLATKENPHDFASITVDFAVSAAENGQTHLIKNCIEKGVDPEILHECIPAAAESGYADMIKLLLDYCPRGNEKLIKRIEEAFILAAKANCCDALEEFLKYGVNVNVVVAHEDRRLKVRKGPALAFAILYGNLEAVNFLLKSPGIDLDILTEGLTLLHLALCARTCRSEIVGVILGRGVSPLQNPVRKDEISILHMLLGAANPLEQSDVELLKRLLSIGCDPKATDKHGNTLLHAVLRRRNVQTIPEEIIFILNESEEMKILPDKTGELPLQLAVRGQATNEIIRALLPKDISLWNSKNLRTFSVLHAAVYPGKIAPSPPLAPPRRLPLINTNPSTLSMTDSISASSSPAPLPPAAIRRPGPGSISDDNEMLRVLDVLLQIADIDVNVIDALGNTPLMIAANHYDEQSSETRARIIKRLLDRGAEVNCFNGGRWTALHLLASTGFVLGIREIFKFDPDLQTLNENGFSPLHQAVSRGKIACVRLWTDQGNAKSPRAEAFAKALQARTSRGLLPLHIAALHNRAEVILLLHDTGRLGDVNAPGLIDQVTPLHLATVAGHIGTMSILIQHGADVNARASVGNTPLHYAAERGAVSAARHLIDNGALADLENWDGMKPWMLADKQNHTELKFALEIAARREVQAENAYGDSTELVVSEGANRASGKGLDMPLFSTLFKIAPIKSKPSSMLDAVSSGTDTEVLAFLATGSDPNEAMGKEGEAPLHIACHRGYTEVVELLLDYGASIDVLDKADNQPLHCASSDGRLDIVKILVDHGASLTARNTDMQIPLHLAAENGWLDVVKILLKASTNTVTTIGTDGKVVSDTGKHDGMSPHLELRDKEGNTALLAALFGDYTDVARFLVQEGADVNAIDICGCGPPFWAGDAADKPFFELLISRGLDINQAAPGGSTALSHVAARLRDQDEATTLAIYLIENGASVFPKPRYNLSPLVFACESGNVGLVKELIKRMTMEEINAPSVTLGAPIYTAAFRGRAEVVKVLLDAGVDYEMKHLGETAFDAAVKEGHSDVVAAFKAFFRKGEGSDGGEGDEGGEDVDVSITQPAVKSEPKSRFEELSSGSRIEELDGDDDESTEESNGEPLPPYSPKS
ncbi:hypothetical protein ONS95_012585 [Cadophora gregata]|uniref:uncharacterized protein n=1 Tax=Cadophora gregata TaxID=51156 RepID=UPI0026DC8062|nr:uncharacterized protein ONS95_012585 [Cadophora gregata]KAK0118289.1 hypothetical protein ONS95_012585 [Cadophora gregata]KAK0123357.1 hypothetical protein ONS96_010350 [Cadophora gregata f. sp. sojae]